MKQPTEVGSWVVGAVRSFDELQQVSARLLAK